MTAGVDVVDMPAGYVLVRDDTDGTYGYLLNGVPVSDGYPTPAHAAADAQDHATERAADWCDTCGDQAVCPECVGT